MPQNKKNVVPKKKVATKSTISISQGFVGPIPPPVVLEQYENILPGSAERILKMAETQANNRHDVSKEVLMSGIKNEKLGLQLAFLSLLIVMAVIVILGMNDKTLPASILGGGGIIGLVSVFVYGSKRKPSKKLDKIDWKEYFLFF